MKIGIRKPSPKKSFKARTTGKVKRKLKKAVNPFYGKKGMGIIRNPKKAMYNKVYSKTTVDSRKLFSGTKKRTNKATTARVKSTQVAKRTSGAQDGASGTWLAVVGVVGVCAIASIPLAVVVLIVIAAYYAYKHFTGQTEPDQTAPDQTAEREPVVEAPALTKDELNRQFWANEDIQSFQSKYYELSESIEAEYKQLNNGEGFSGQRGDKLVEDCRMGIEMAKSLVDIWNHYQEDIPRIQVYYRLAMVYEKRCDYTNAILVCVEAIKAGQSNDGTKGGMAARIQRLAKKGNITLDEDTLALLEKAKSSSGAGASREGEEM